jgi:hypothetical protein
MTAIDRENLRRVAEAGLHVNPSVTLALLDRLEALERVASAARRSKADGLVSCFPEPNCAGCELHDALAMLDGGKE